MTEQEANPPAEPLTSAQPFQSGRVRATLTVVLLLTFAALCLAGILTSMLLIGLYEDVAAGRALSEERQGLAALLEGLVAILLALVNLATVVAFCFWIHRAYRNLPALGNPPQSLDYSPGWAVGWFFVPLANIIMPYRVTKEIWEKSDPAVRTKDDFMYSAASVPALLVVWWVSWLLSNAGERLVSRFMDDGGPLETLIWVQKASMVSNAVWVVSAVLAALVVRGIDRRQEERARHVVYRPDAPPPPPRFAPQATPGSQ